MRVCGVGVGVQACTSMWECVCACVSLRVRGVCGVHSLYTEIRASKLAAGLNRS